MILCQVCSFNGKSLKYLHFDSCFFPGLVTEEGMAFCSWLALTCSVVSAEEGEVLAYLRVALGCWFGLGDLGGGVVWGFF